MFHTNKTSNKYEVSEISLYKLSIFQGIVKSLFQKLLFSSGKKLISSLSLEGSIQAQSQQRHKQATFPQKGINPGRTVFFSAGPRPGLLYGGIHMVTAKKSRFHPEFPSRLLPTFHLSSALASLHQIVKNKSYCLGVVCPHRKHRLASVPIKVL